MRRFARNGKATSVLTRFPVEGAGKLYGGIKVKEPDVEGRTA